MLILIILYLKKIEFLIYCNIFSFINICSYLSIMNIMCESSNKNNSDLTINIKTQKKSTKTNLANDKTGKTPRIDCKKRNQYSEDDKKINIMQNKVKKMKKCNKEHDTHEKCIEDNLIQCPICMDNKKENKIMTCTHCNFKWCKECLKNSDYLFYDCQERRSNGFFTVDDIKELITLQSCPICRKFRTFEEAKFNERYINFKYQFIDLIKYYSKNLNYGNTKDYNCLNCNDNIIQKSNKVIPQCNKCNLFNMMEIP